MAGKILIVDDVATNRIVYKVKLGAACYEPMLAADGAGCLKLAHDEKPDLILLDMILPDMSGTQVLRKLRADPVTADIPVLVFSAKNTTKLRMEALQAGADDFLSKATDDQTLLARLRNLLRGRETIAELETGGAPIQALGFAESADKFVLPGMIAIVTHHAETALRWRRKLSSEIPDQLVLISREEALAGPTYALVPDIFVIETDLCDPMGGLRLMSELRSRSQTRHAAICIIKEGELTTNSAIAYDLGANDLVHADVDPRELGIRLARLMRRKREADRLRASVRDGLRMAVIDPLTGLYNRRFAVSQLANIAQSAREAGTSFAVMVVDLDRFKNVNDQHGHPAGDAVLVEVARRLTANLRSGDLLARIGGEEFLIALPETDLSKAGPIAERLCRSIQESPVILPGFGNLDLTASIGLAICDAGLSIPKEQVAEVIDRADQALLIAKSGGRNQVTVSKTAA